MDYKRLIKITDGVGGGAKLEPIYFDSASPDEMGYDYITYQEWCEANGYNCASEDSDEFRQWVDSSVDNAWKEVKYIIENYESGNYAHYIVEGDIQRWGDEQGGFEVFDSLMEAVDFCISELDGFFMETSRKGTILIQGLSYDGRHYYEIKQMSDEAYERCEELDYEGEGFSFVPMC